jgi:hypothetical protein
MIFDNVCHCKCHEKNYQVKHVMPCCGTCDICNKRIRLMALDLHRKECQEKKEAQLKQVREIIERAAPPKKECEHNWVMDGHNAGDPICSKCYKRE